MMESRSSWGLIEVDIKKTSITKSKDRYWPLAPTYLLEGFGVFMVGLSQFQGFSNTSFSPVLYRTGYEAAISRFKICHSQYWWLDLTHSKNWYSTQIWLEIIVTHRGSNSWELLLALTLENYFDLLLRIINWFSWERWEELTMMLLWIINETQRRSDSAKKNW